MSFGTLVHYPDTFVTNYAYYPNLSILIPKFDVRSSLKIVQQAQESCVQQCRLPAHALPTPPIGHLMFEGGNAEHLRKTNLSNKVGNAAEMQRDQCTICLAIWDLLMMPAVIQLNFAVRFLAMDEYSLQTAPRSRINKMENAKNSNSSEPEDFSILVVVSSGFFGLFLSFLIVFQDIQFNLLSTIICLMLFTSSIFFSIFRNGKGINTKIYLIISIFTSISIFIANYAYYFIFDLFGTTSGTVLLFSGSVQLSFCMIQVGAILGLRFKGAIGLY